MAGGEEPGLEGGFVDGEEEAQEAGMFEPEDLEAVRLGEVPDGAAAPEQVGGDGFGGDVGDEVERPVEHFDEEGEFREDPAVDVVGEAGVVGGADRGEAAAGAGSVAGGGG